MSYRIVDAADDAILVECEWPEDVLRVLKQLRKEQPEREVLVGWFGVNEGPLVGYRAFGRARALTAAEVFALYGRRGRR